MIEDSYGSMREESLIDLEQTCFIIYEHVKEMSLILGSKITNLDSFFGELSQPQQTLFKLICFMGILIKFLEPFTIADLISQMALANIFPNFLDALNK